MAYLSLNTLEPVDFGGRECVPKLDTETKLRLSQIKKYDSKACEVIATAFPDDEEYVKGFLANMTTIDIQLLHAYLIGGPTMVDAIRQQMGNAMSNAIKEAK